MLAVTRDSVPTLKREQIYPKMNHPSFIPPNFLLQNDTAVALFQSVADLPIMDYHNHLNPADLANNRQYENMTQLWLSLDPYKHRMMRINGVPEEQITGPASDREKFQRWAETLPRVLGNPLFHWSALELKRVFDIDELLTPDSAERIWKLCNEKLQNDDYRLLNLMKYWNVQWMSTSDDLLSDLEPHRQVSLTNELEVCPSLRGDAMLAFEQANFANWLSTLSEQTGQAIHSLEDYQVAIAQKLDHFVEAQCRLADHALDPDFHFSLPTEQEAARYFRQVVNREALNPKEATQLKSYLLHFLGRAYAERGWILQLHIGAQRSTSSRLKQLAGSAGGYASIGTTCDIDSLCRFLDSLEQASQLPKIILYTLNPSDYEALASLTGSFAEDGVPGKIQLGPAWWYNDHYEGIQRHLTVLASYGMLSRFVGMTTDSRSPLSFSRHEYFRRILCNTVGTWAEEGQLPADIDMLSTLVRDISCQNAEQWIQHKSTIHH